MFAPLAGLTFEKLLGRGSSFEVALVRAPSGEPLVAKRLLPGLVGNPDARRALDREAAVLEALHHPALPRLVASGTDEVGRYVLEAFIEGSSLADRALPDATLGHAAASLMAELQTLSDERGPFDFVHGDLHPAHFVRTTGAARAAAPLALVDFGASTLRGAPPSAGRGTMPFAAPELCRGETVPTQATDRYVLAVVLARILSGGAQLWRASNEPGLLLEIGERGHDLSALSVLPVRVRSALEAHLAFDPEQRPEDLSDLVRALETRG